MHFNQIEGRIQVTSQLYGYRNGTGRFVNCQKIPLRSDDELPFVNG